MKKVYCINCQKCVIDSDENYSCTIYNLHYKQREKIDTTVFPYTSKYCAYFVDDKI